MLTPGTNGERSGIYVGVRFGPHGEPDYSRAAEMLGPEAVTLAATIAADRETKRTAFAEKRAVKTREIEAMRPRSAGKVLARVVDALVLTRERIDADRRVHRQPSVGDVALAAKLDIETRLLSPHLSAHQQGEGYVAVDPDAKDVAGAIESSTRIRDWVTIRQKYGPDTRTKFDSLNPYETPQPVSVFLEAANDLCGRLYNEASA